MVSHDDARNDIKQGCNWSSYRVSPGSNPIILRGSRLPVPIHNAQLNGSDLSSHFTTLILVVLTAHDTCIHYLWFSNMSEMDPVLALRGIVLFARTALDITDLAAHEVARLFQLWDWYESSAFPLYIFGSRTTWRIQA